MVRKRGRCGFITDGGPRPGTPWPVLGRPPPVLERPCPVPGRPPILMCLQHAGAAAAGLLGGLRAGARLPDPVHPARQHGQDAPWQRRSRPPTPSKPRPKAPGCFTHPRGELQSLICQREAVLPTWGRGHGAESAAFDHAGAPSRRGCASSCSASCTAGPARASSEQPRGRGGERFG